MPDWRQRSPLWEQSVVPSEQFTRPKHWEEHRVLKYVHAFGAQPPPVHNVAAPEKPKMTQLELAQLPGAGSQLAQVAVEATQYWVERHWAQMDQTPCSRSTISDLRSMSDDGARSFEKK